MCVVFLGIGSRVGRGEGIFDGGEWEMLVWVRVLRCTCGCVVGRGLYVLDVFTRAGMWTGLV